MNDPEKLPRVRIKGRPFFRTGIPPVVLWLVGAIVLAHLVRILLPEAWQDAAFLHFALVPGFLTAADSPYDSAFDRMLPFLAHPFLHAGAIHLAFNSLAILDIGTALVRVQGALRFLLVFVVSAIAGAVLFVLINPHLEAPAIGASGAACGLFGAFAGGILLRTRSAQRKRKRKQISRSIFWFLAINVGLAAAARMGDVIPIAWEAHLGGFLAGLPMGFAMRPRRLPEQQLPAPRQ